MKLPRLHSEVSYKKSKINWAPQPNVNARKTHNATHPPRFDVMGKNNTKKTQKLKKHDQTVCVL